MLNYVSTAYSALHKITDLMADFHITPMPTIVEETFQNETNKVFFFEGIRLPTDLEDFGDLGDIFAFQGIRGLEVERRLFTKTYPTQKTTSRWIEAQYGQHHQKKSANYLILNLGLPFWPTWHRFSRDYDFTDSPIPRSNFDFFFRSHANRQPGWSASDFDLEGDNENVWFVSFLLPVVFICLLISYKEMGN